MNQKIKKHLESYCLKNDWSFTESVIEEILAEAEPIFEELFDERRWWNEYFVVVEVDGMEIGYYEGRTTGDESAFDKGYEFDLDSICEVEKKEETIVKYVPKSE